MKNKLVIFGSTDIAELALYYFNNDSNYEVSAFTVDKDHIKQETFCGLPIVDFAQIDEFYPPTDYQIFIAIGYNNLNELRKSKYIEAKMKGYKLASYVSSKATVLNNRQFGENCFIFEDNTIQPFVKIGNNITLWSGNHIGHHSLIKDHTFLASHVVVSGGVQIGEQCFIGVNATLRDHIEIGDRCIIGAGALILTDTMADGVYLGSATSRSKVPSSRLRKI